MMMNRWLLLIACLVRSVSFAGANEPIFPAAYSYDVEPDDFHLLAHFGEWINNERNLAESSFSYSYTSEDDNVSHSPTHEPTRTPSQEPSRAPSRAPSGPPSHVPTHLPSSTPTIPRPTHSPTLLPTPGETVGASVTFNILGAGPPTQTDSDAVLSALHSSILSLFGDTSQVRDFELSSSGVTRRRLLTMVWTVSFRVTVLQSAVSEQLAGGGSAAVASQVASALADLSFTSAVASTTETTASVDTSSIAAQVSSRHPVTHPPSPPPSQPPTSSPTAATVEAAGSNANDGGTHSPSSASSALLVVLIPLGLVFVAGAGYVARVKLAGNANVKRSSLSVSEAQASIAEAQGSLFNPLGYTSDEEFGWRDTDDRANTEPGILPASASDGDRKPVKLSSKSDLDENPFDIDLGTVAPSENAVHSTFGESPDREGFKRGGSFGEGRFEEEAGQFHESPVVMHAACFQEHTTAIQATARVPTEVPTDLLSVEPPPSSSPPSLLPRLPDESPQRHGSSQQEPQEGDLLGSYVETI